MTNPIESVETLNSIDSPRTRRSRRNDRVRRFSWNLRCTSEKLGSRNWNESQAEDYAAHVGACMLAHERVQPRMNMHIHLCVRRTALSKFVLVSFSQLVPQPLLPRSYNEIESVEKNENAMARRRHYVQRIDQVFA